MPHQISDTDLLDDLRRVATQIGHSPTEAEYNEHGQYSAYTLRKRFGSIPEARKAAGLNEGDKKVSNPDEILADIQEVAEQLGRAPSQSEYRERGTYSVRTVYNYFDSWVSARQSAGINEGPTQIQKVPEDALLTAIKQLAEDVARVPSQSDMNEDGEYSEEVFHRRFGSWSTAVRKAGFEPRRRGAQPGEENSYWRGGYEPYYGPNWYEQRRKAKNRDNHECVKCGKTDEEHLEEYGWELEVHHIVPASSFQDYQKMNDLENLITLCRKHHRKYEELPAIECRKLRNGD